MRFNNQILINFSIIGFFGYITFHSHRFGKDCWLCQYRGLAVLVGSVSLGAYLGISDN